MFVRSAFLQHFLLFHFQVYYVAWYPGENDAIIFGKSFQFSASINKVLDLCLLDFLFQGDLSFGVSNGLSLLSDIFWGGVDY